MIVKSSSLRRRLLQNTGGIEDAGLRDRRAFVPKDNTVGIRTITATAKKLPGRPATSNPQPGDADAWNRMGSILVERGEIAESSECFATAVRIDPNFLQALNNLAVVLQRLGQLAAAETRYREALQRAPDNLEIGLNFAALLGSLGRYSEALDIVERVLERSPDLVRAWVLAAALECDVGRRAAALARIERALAIAPDQPKILTRRAQILCQLGRCADALEDCNRALSMIPNDAETLHEKALALQALNRPEAALETFRLAEAADLAPATAVADRGWLLAEMGRKDEAMIAIDQALRLQPDLSSAWYYRTNLTRYTRGHPDLAIMERIADNPDLPFRDRVLLSFALGKAFLDDGDGPRAFARLETGNRLKRTTLDYDPDAEARRFAGIVATFSAENLSRVAGSGDPSGRPVFVFGMPRSGTTLVEQILASHRLVHGAGEPSHLRDIAEASGVHARVTEMGAGEFAGLGHRYLDLVGAGTPDTLRLIDKMPLNFLHAGLISLILPNARMIHCRRDPLDTCLSVYSLLFTSGHEYSYDFRELGRFYRLYRTLMAHWRRVLPPENFLEIDYEALVGDTERQVRRLLDFCDLPWDADCLRFHETRRRVTSASLDQVRSPIYTQSIARAQAFRPWLGVLEETLVDLPPD
jgi:tetratricopeptide (TPR) repeat protein